MLALCQVSQTVFPLPHVLQQAVGEKCNSSYEHGENIDMKSLASARVLGARLLMRFHLAPLLRDWASMGIDSSVKLEAAPVDVSECCQELDVEQHRADTYACRCVNMVPSSRVTFVLDRLHFHH